MKKSIFKKDKKYTFHDYFEMTNPTEEIVGEFGYSFSLEVIDLPEYRNYEPDPIENLRNTYYKILPRITLTSEIAKREFLIAPILLEIVKNTDSRINVEYPLEVNDKLSGSLDYLIRSDRDMIIIEAKKGELDRGFNQLAAELIAMDKYEEDSPAELLYGAVTIGEIWKFGILQRKQKHLTKDMHSFRIPEDTEKIFSVLMGIINKA
ncbi:MAG: hypothetical protein DRI57_31015 [Deltaproteobacteria bacterium]|nr:MAG: hypothetical protein DRI57_31015 [Deltaproteobacteria bacterium]